mmetsp:Transcript_70915/g.134036  ORF Transcript_70915/g.134036 Transcript_70915/m.134036 type:complete len:285 (-) Transcript_70915:69-923(-)
MHKGFIVLACLLHSGHALTTQKTSLTEQGSSPAELQGLQAEDRTMSSHRSLAELQQPYSNGTKLVTTLARFLLAFSDPWPGCHIACHGCSRPFVKPRSDHIPSLMASERPIVKESMDPFSIVQASYFLATIFRGEMIFKTDFMNTCLFITAFYFPGVLPNDFADTRFAPRVWNARDAQGRVIGVLQTCLMNARLTRPDGTRGDLRTLRFFQNIVVAKAWRRRGVATSMVNTASAVQSPYDSALTVETNNTGAIDLYRKLGFEMVQGEPERGGYSLMMREDAAPA